jgi:subtilisin family serine protease
MKQLVCIILTVFFSSLSAISNAQPTPKLEGSFDIAQHPLIINKDNLKKTYNGLMKKGVGRRVGALALVDHNFIPSELSKYGWRCISRIGDVATLEGDESTAPYLTALHGILYVKKSSPVYVYMDSARKVTNVDQLHGTRPGGLTRKFSGKKVLFGIIDTEFDTRHPEFRDSLNNMRFVSLWDQTDTSNAIVNRYGYGTIKNHTQLMADDSFGFGPHYHGTLTASLAAGSNLKSKYYGVAPATSIVAVKMGKGDQTIVDGLRWIFSIADSLKLPCVVNLSLGNHDGPHDGTSLVDRAIDSLSKAGHIVVGAAGNDNGLFSHVALSIGSGEKKGTWVTPAVNSSESGVAPGVSGIEIWGEANKTLSATFYLLDTVKMTYRISRQTVSTTVTRLFNPDTIEWLDSTTLHKDTVIFHLLVEKKSPLNGKPHLQAVATSTNPALYMGVLLSVSGTTGGLVNAWSLVRKSLRSFSLAGYYDGDSLSSICELGGTGKSTITVGAYQSKGLQVLWDGKTDGVDDFGIHTLCGYSGRGPTIDGRIKPDITAPGSNLVGAMPRNIPDGLVVVWPDTTSREGRYCLSGGTSMASPVVAGIVALMLEADSSLTPAKVKQILQESAITDGTTGVISSPNNLWGAGKVNALGAMQKLLGIPVKEKNRKVAESSPMFMLESGAQGRIYIKNIPDVQSGQIYLQIFSMQGRLLLNKALSMNGSVTLPEQLPSGIYMVRAVNRGTVLCSSRIVKTKRIATAIQ